MSPAEIADWSARCEAHVAAVMDGDAAHDHGHVRRVVRTARHLAEAEGADLGVVVPAAWLHDVVSVPKDSADRSRASSLAAEAATDWLRVEAFPEDRLAAVAHAIEAHSWSAGIETRTIEAAVVQDADRLDALGAVGIARLYATAGAMGSALMHPTDPVPAEPPTRALDDRAWATDHVRTKLLALPATLRTTAARVEAARRVAFVRAFLRQLSTEVGAA